MRRVDSVDTTKGNGMNEQECLELAKIANAIMAEKLGAPEGTSYMKPNPSLPPFSKELPLGTSVQQAAEKLARQCLEILGIEVDDL